MPLVMMVISSERVRLREKGAYGERRFGLPHEDGGRHVERFGSRDAHRPLHAPGKAANDDLHDAEVVKRGKERRDEDDGGQHLESEDGAEGGVLLAKIPKDKFRAGEGVAEQLVDAVPGRCHGVAAEAPAQHEKSKGDLQADAPGHGAYADGATIRREEPCQQQHGEQAKDSSESRQRSVLNGVSRLQSGPEYRG